MTSIAAKCKSYDATPAFDLSAATTVPQLILFARIIRRHRVMYPCVVCLSVCMSVTLVHPAKFVGQNQMPFSMDIVWPQITLCSMGHRSPVEGRFGGQNPESSRSCKDKDLALARTLPHSASAVWWTVALVYDKKWQLPCTIQVPFVQCQSAATNSKHLQSSIRCMSASVWRWWCLSPYYFDPCCCIRCH